MGTCYLFSDIEHVLEDHQASIPDRLERRDVAAIEPALDAGARVHAGQLHFRLRTGTQARVGFDECGV